jgi:hypothetical protein
MSGPYKDEVSPDELEDYIEWRELLNELKKLQSRAIDLEQRWNADRWSEVVKDSDLSVVIIQLGVAIEAHMEFKPQF